MPKNHPINSMAMEVVPYSFREPGTDVGCGEEVEDTKNYNPKPTHPNFQELKKKMLEEGRREKLRQWLQNPPKGLIKFLKNYKEPDGPKSSTSLSPQVTPGKEKSSSPPIRSSKTNEKSAWLLPHKSFCMDSSEFPEEELLRAALWAAECLPLKLVDDEEGAKAWIHKMAPLRVKGLHPDIISEEDAAYYIVSTMEKIPAMTDDHKLVVDAKSAHETIMKGIADEIKGLKKQLKTLRKSKSSSEIEQNIINMEIEIASEEQKHKTAWSVAIVEIEEARQKGEELLKAEKAEKAKKAEEAAAAKAKKAAEAAAAKAKKAEEAAARNPKKAATQAKKAKKTAADKPEKAEKAAAKKPSKRKKEESTSARKSQKIANSAELETKPMEEDSSNASVTTLLPSTVRSKKEPPKPEPLPKKVTIKRKLSQPFVMVDNEQREELLKYKKELVENKKTMSGLTPNAIKAVIEERMAKKIPSDSNVDGVTEKAKDDTAGVQVPKNTSEASQVGSFMKKMKELLLELPRHDQGKRATKVLGHGNKEESSAINGVHQVELVVSHRNGLLLDRAMKFVSDASDACVEVFYDPRFHPFLSRMTGPALKDFFQ
jgi:chemotaxis protein histidine kinase CheA